MSDASLRAHVLYLLRGGGAHLAFDQATSELPADLRGITPPGLPHSPWELVEHLRICQWDIVQFSVDPAHVSPEFPDGYWPASSVPPTDTAWDESCDQFRRDLERMCQLVEDARTDLFAVIPHGDGQTILREALLVADHNAYHLGQLVDVRRLLGAWEDQAQPYSGEE